MSDHNTINNTIKFRNINESIEKCQKTLEKISTTCCMPERSKSMNEAFTKLDNLFSVIREAESNDKNIVSAIEGLGVFGSVMGRQYATCCTTTREPLYQAIFKELNIAHSYLWEILGVAH